MSSSKLLYFISTFPDLEEPDILVGNPILSSIKLLKFSMYISGSIDSFLVNFFMFLPNFSICLTVSFFVIISSATWSNLDSSEKASRAKAWPLLIFPSLIYSGNGSVNINCDVSNEPYDQPINFNFNLVVKFGQEYNNENDSILIIPHGSHEINIAQYIYELIVLSIPQKRIHPGVEDGTLNSEILRKLEDLSPNTDLKGESSSNDVDPRWNKLKKLLTDKE